MAGREGAQPVVLLTGSAYRVMLHMRMVHYSKRAAVIFLLICLAGGCNAPKDPQNPAKNNESGNAREGLKPMPWYDAPKDDYKKYSPEEIRKVMGKMKSKPQQSAPGLSLPAGFLQLLVYAIIAAVLCAAIYLVIRTWRERNLALPATVSKGEDGVIIHEAIVAGLDATPLQEHDLARKTKEALDRGDFQAASRFMFLFALLAFSKKELLELRSSRTAREYVRLLAARDNADEKKVRLLSDIARCFEIAVYRQAPPDGDLFDLWYRLQREVA